MIVAVAAASTAAAVLATILVGGAAPVAGAPETGAVVGKLQSGAVCFGDHERLKD